MWGYVLGWAAMMTANIPVAFTLGIVAFAFLWIEGGPMVNPLGLLFHQRQLDQRSGPLAAGGQRRRS